MSETLESVANDVDQRQLAEQLLAQAKEQGVELVGPNGLLNQLTKNVLETALDAEMTEHLGYDKHDPAGRGSGNSRNGTRAKTVFTEIGPVEIEVPRDTNASFDPQIVRKRQRRLTGIDEIVLSLTAKGLTTGEIAAHFDDVYGATVSKDTISKITDKVVEEMTEWCNRPLEPVYPVVFIDAILVKIRDGQVTNRPVYVAIGVTCTGERDILGLWAGDGGEGAKFWLSVLTEIKNRGTADVCIVVCDGLKGLPEAVNTVWDRAVIQTCVIHLLRNTFRYASRKYWDQIAKDIRPVYTAATEAAAKERFVEFTASWGAQYPAIIKLWENAWSEFVPFLDYDVEIRRVICSTNAIESLNARYRRAIRARGHFPTEQAALKCLYLVTRSLDPTGRGKARWAMRWKPALNAFAITFNGRITPT
ncbi:IS256 family transposase, partial [Mycobacterium sherrisii]|uniref:IS256 family transposase n=2 Tax=Mycobacterium sherrisii TaxID=243061 RepID=UPI000A1579E4